MSNEILKCACCGYEAGKRQWSRLELGSDYLVGLIYNDQSGKQEHIGSVTLYACPNCKTVTFNR
jgi:hypothetical protein